jgi:hypothetical protein
MLHGIFRRKFINAKIPTPEIGFIESITRCGIIHRLIAYPACFAIKI